MEKWNKVHYIHTLDYRASTKSSTKPCSRVDIFYKRVTQYSVQHNLYLDTDFILDKDVPIFICLQKKYWKNIC